MVEKYSSSSFHQLVRDEIQGYYFEAYSELETHEVMLKDYSRTMAYKRAIETNKHLFKGKIVLDVGCGMGILSLFAASAGAKLVIGIDASNIVHYANKVVKANGFNNIIILHSKVEDVDKLPNGIQSIDIIISEWMGINLFNESMLGTVLYARDKWLKPGGLMFPDKAQLYLAGFFDPEKRARLEKWNKISGFDLNELRTLMYKDAALSTVKPETVTTDYFLLKELDLHTASPDYSFSIEYKLTSRKNSHISGFFTYFDASFSKCHKEVTLSTSPNYPLTHWRQTVFLFDESVWLDCGSSVVGTFTVRPHMNNFRNLAISITVDAFNNYTAHKFTSEYTLR